MEVLLKHKTIRKFKDQPVSSELLNQILTAGCRASTTGNMQVYSIIVSEDEDIKNQLIPLHFNQPVAKSAPILITFCADFHRFVRWCEMRNAEPGYDNFLSFLTAAIDVLLVAQNACIAAEDKGLGICYLGTTTYNAKEIIEVLDLPKLVFPVTTIAIGWPDENPPMVDRLPLEAVVHKEKYRSYTEGQINSYYAYKESLKESLQFIKENDKETLAQVFTDVRYKKGDNEYFSDKVLEVLKEQGFM